MVNKNFVKRKKKVRSKIIGTRVRPRMTVHRSNKRLYVQLIDDKAGETLLGISSCKLGKNAQNKTKVQIGALLGEKIAKEALKRKIQKVVFDRSGYKYHGRIKSVAESARKGGLKF